MQWAFLPTHGCLAVLELCSHGHQSLGHAPDFTRTGCQSWAGRAGACKWRGIVGGMSGELVGWAFGVNSGLRKPPPPPLSARPAGRGTVIAWVRGKRYLSGTGGGYASFCWWVSCWGGGSVAELVLMDSHFLFRFPLLKQRHIGYLRGFVGGAVGGSCFGPRGRILSILDAGHFSSFPFGAPPCVGTWRWFVVGQIPEVARRSSMLVRSCNHGAPCPICSICDTMCTGPESAWRLSSVHPGGFGCWIMLFAPFTWRLGVCDVSGGFTSVIPYLADLYFVPAASTRWVLVGYLASSRRLFGIPLVAQRVWHCLCFCVF